MGLPSMTPSTNKPTSIPKVMTTSEVAAHLKCSTRYVRGLIHGGKLRATRLCDGGRYRIYEDSVSSLLGIRVQKPSREALYRRALIAGARAGFSQLPGDGTA